MNLNDFFERIPLFNRVSSVLVCEVDFSGLKAAVITRKGHDLAVLFETSSDNPDFVAAVAEVVTFVRAKGWSGKAAALLNPAVMLTLLELPIAAKNKLAPKQLAEQIEYELEPLINQHLGNLTIGRLLVTKKMLTEDQLSEILNHQADLNNPQNSSFSSNKNEYLQFGEVAESLGFITQSRIKEYLTRQAAFKSTGEDLQCGWAAQGMAIGDNAMPNMHHWLASAVNKPLLRQWQAAFTAQGLKLSSMYPLVGCAASLLSTHAKNRAQQILIEATNQSLAGIHLANNQVHGLHILPNSLELMPTIALEAYQLLEQFDVDHVLLGSTVSNNVQEAQRLQVNLERTLEKPIRLVQNPALSENSQTTLGMLGVARHVMRMKGANLITGVSVHEPQPPLMQHLGVRAFLACLVLLFTILVAESVLKVREGLIKSENDSLSVELKRLDEAVTRSKKLMGEVKVLKEQVKTLKDNKKSVSNTLDLLSIKLPKRNQTVFTILNDLAKLSSSDMVVNLISEDPISGFHLEAWSLNDKSAQEFIKNFQMLAQPLGYEVRDIKVVPGVGRLGLMGYNIVFNATALSESEWQEQRLTKEQEEMAAPKVESQPTLNDKAVQNLPSISGADSALLINPNINKSVGNEVVVEANNQLIATSPTNNAVEKQ
jgi:hypothetical protein